MLAGYKDGHVAGSKDSLRWKRCQSTGTQRGEGRELPVSAPHQGQDRVPRLPLGAAALLCTMALLREVLPQRDPFCNTDKKTAEILFLSSLPLGSLFSSNLSPSPCIRSSSSCICLRASLFWQSQANLLLFERLFICHTASTLWRWFSATFFSTNSTSGSWSYLPSRGSAPFQRSVLLCPGSAPACSSRGAGRSLAGFVCDECEHINNNNNNKKAIVSKCRIINILQIPFDRVHLGHRISAQSTRTPCCFFLTF